VNQQHELSKIANRIFINQIIVIYNNTFNIWAALSQSAHNVRDISNTCTVTYVAHSQLYTNDTIDPNPTRPNMLWSGVIGSGRGRVGGGVSRSRSGITMKRWTTVTSRYTYVKQRQTEKQTETETSAFDTTHGVLSVDRNLEPRHLHINYVVNTCTCAGKGFVLYRA